MISAKIHNYCNILPIACGKPRVIVRKDMRNCLFRFDYVVIAGVVHETQYFIETFRLPDIKNIHVSDENALSSIRYLSATNGFAVLRGGEYYIIETFWKLVPCGKCDTCRYNKSCEWTTRVQLEMFDNPNAQFITLTYDNEHLPKDGELCYEDFQKFLKRLRITIERRFGYTADIRFVCCGEYGHLFHRCHFHFIVWNLPDLRKDPHETIPYFYRVKEFITPIWKNGLVDVGHYVSQDTIRYITKYMLKPDEWAQKNRKVQPFFKASRRPGIGGNYFNAKRIEDIKNADDLKLHISVNGVCLDLALSGYCIDKVYKSNSKIICKRITTDKVPDSITQGVLDPYRISFSKYINLHENMQCHRYAVLFLESIINIRENVGLFDYLFEFDDVNDPFHLKPLIECKSTTDGIGYSNPLSCMFSKQYQVDKLKELIIRFNNVADNIESYLTYFAYPPDVEDTISIYRHYQDKISALNSLLADQLCEQSLKECDLFVSASNKRNKQYIHYLLTRGNDGQ